MTGPDGATPPPAGHNANGPGGWESFAAADAAASHSSPTPTPGSAAEISGLSRLLTRQVVVPAAALAVAIIAVVVSFASSGGGGNIFANSSSDEEVCSAYRAAERSWDSWDTDATEVEKLGSVASRHSDEEVRSAGESLNNLTGMFSYGRYSTIVQPIQLLC